MKKYRDSGVEWIGSIPEGWRVQRLKWNVSKIGSGKTPKGGSEVYSESGIAFLRSQNVRFEGLSLNDVVFIDTKIDEDMVSTRVQPLDVLLNITGASIGRCCIVPKSFGSANVNQHVCILRVLKHRIDPKFLQNLMSSDIVQTQIMSQEKGTSREGLSLNQIANLILIVPPIQEQIQIANFLDQKTSEIDSLISDKEKLIQLLEEYRESMITEAVIKGLNPNVKMKDSGVEWIGEIPEHWETIRAKHIFNERSVKGVPDKRLLSVSKGKGVLPRDEMDSKVVMAFKDLHNFKLVQANDFVIHLRSFQSGFEMSNIIEGIVSPAYTIFRLKSEGDPRYYKYLFYSNVFIDAIASTTQSLRDGKPVAYSDFGNMRIAVPSLQEQYEIAIHLEVILKDIDELITEKKAIIQKLKEYRQSLIYEAVTGKIGVRNWEVVS